MSDCQRTLARETSIRGAGLHTGRTTTVRVVPATASTGIVFLRTDLPNRPTIPAIPAHVVESGGSLRRSTLVKDGVEVKTIEHFMAALWGLGLDNAFVELDGPEMPGLDGSAAQYVELLKSGGVTEQDAPRKYFSPREPILVEEADAALAVFPGRSFRVSYTLSYDHPGLRGQFAAFAQDGSASFEQMIAPARTFCLMEEADALRAKGFGKGANEENTVLIDREGRAQSPLRFEDEFVRHKILDLLGDLYLLGAHLRGRVIAMKSGHALNAKLVHKLDQAMAQWKLGAICSGTDEVMVGPQLDIMQIQQILPHRYPFLLVDRITDLADNKAIGIKCVTINDYFFRGHFPGRPVMPGVLMIEAMAQVGGILLLNKPENKGKLAYFMSIDNVKFRKPVVPGDQLVIEAELVKVRSRVGQIMARALVDGKPVCEGELMFAIADD